MIQGGDPTSKNNSQKTKIGNGGPGYTLLQSLPLNISIKKALLLQHEWGMPLTQRKNLQARNFILWKVRLLTKKL